MKRVVFILGFSIGLAVFGLANAYSYHIALPRIDDGFITFGFPFPLGQYGGFVTRTSFNLVGILIDGIFAVVSIVALGYEFTNWIPELIGHLNKAHRWHFRTRL